MTKTTKQKKTMKKKVSSQIINYILCLSAFLSSLSSCNTETEIKERNQESLPAIYKLDATRMVNKVLDSTHIARLSGFDKDGRCAIYKNDFIKKYNIQITSKHYFLSEDCDSLEPNIEARVGKCWFLEFIQIDSISENIYRLHFAVPYKERGGYYDFNINDYTIVDSTKVYYKASSNTCRYVLWNDDEKQKSKKLYESYVPQIQDTFYLKVLPVEIPFSNPYIDFVCNYFEGQKYITINPHQYLDSDTIVLWMGAEAPDSKSVSDNSLKKTTLCFSIKDIIIMLLNNDILYSSVTRCLPYTPIKSHPQKNIEKYKELVAFISPEKIEFWPIRNGNNCSYYIDPIVYKYIYKTCKLLIPLFD